MLKKFACCLTVVAGVLAGCGGPTTPASENAGNLVQPSTVPSTLAPGHMVRVRPPEHIVIVIEENHSYDEIAGNAKAPYINALMKQGATFTNYHGVEHPSQPNYLDLFSGSNQGITNDSCPHTFSAPNLASELAAAGLSFAGYSEDLPSMGYTGCSNGRYGLPLGATYARKHSPWVNFTNVPPSDNLPFSSFPKDFSKLPTVAFVIPNLQHDMHSGSIEAADTWLRQYIQPYVEWARLHNGLLVVTWDEDDESADNRVPTIFVGPMIRSGTFSERVNHFNLLRTIEDVYGLPPLGQSAHVAPIADVWR
ncbi:alkaline phosphatase family protein [Alicyclobacillus macrosporangiidus]|uniref:alkaline phosphatase family protein n=1 Tax=Alicyclobacillus macrosporangiidus TaxID=392015 RepID=UPI00049615DA|nr:alkaline phosphatase family protein [Alicyclobacillus macrosporangiidus]